MTTVSTTDPTSNRFSSFVYVPLATRKAFKYMRSFIVVNACHYTSPYKQTLFIAVGIDADGAILPSTVRPRGRRSYSKKADRKRGVNSSASKRSY